MEILLLLIGYVSLTIYLANRATILDKMDPLLEILLLGYAVIALLAGIIIVMAMMSPGAELPTPIDGTIGLLFIILSVIAAGIIFMIVRSQAFRQKLGLLFARLIYGGGDRASFEISYNPNSPMHTTAVVLALAETIYILWGFVLSGGIEGIANNLASNAVTISELIFSTIVTVLVALLGVGFLIRRDVQATLSRLGLRMPTVNDWRWGLSFGAGLFILSIILSIIWSVLTPPELLEEQTAASNQILATFSESLASGFLLSASAAVGEEILFRGALQPVFGLLPTSIFFVVLHTQYTLTPATFILLFIALGFGWLRGRFSTTAAMIAHFTYNFIPFVILMLAESFVNVSL